MSKDVTSERLIGAIRRAVQGEILFDQKQIERIHGWKKEVEEKLSQLTPQENETIKLLAKGLDNKSIASALVISEKTAAYHVTNTLKKLSLKNRQEAMTWALKYLSDNLE